MTRRRGLCAVCQARRSRYAPQDRQEASPLANGPSCAIVIDGTLGVVYVYMLLHSCLRQGITERIRATPGATMR